MALTPPGLLLALQNEGLYSPAIAQELQQLIAAIQQWAGGTGFANVPNDSTIAGNLTVTTQPAFRVFCDTAVTIPNTTEYPIQWLAPGTDALAFWQFDTTGAFDTPSTVWMSLPGTYLIQARIRWVGGAGAGASRGVQMRIYGDDLVGDTNYIPATGSYSQHVSSVVRITQDILDKAASPRGIPVQIEAYQDSGGALALTASSWFSVVKLF